MWADISHLLQVAIVTVGLAVAAWFFAYAAMGLLARTIKRITEMIRKRRTAIDRRTFPAIAWGIIALVAGLILVLLIAKMMQPG